MKLSPMPELTAAERRLEARFAYERAREIVEFDCRPIRPITIPPFFDTADYYEKPSQISNALKYLRARGLIVDGVQPHSVRVKGTK